MKNAEKRYEGLFILDMAGKEEGVKDAVDRISTEITTLGGKVETVQKMDKKMSAGFYVNVIFHGPPAILEQLKRRFASNDEVFRVLFTNAPEVKPAAAAN